MFKGIENCRRFMRAKLANITPKTRVYCVSVNGDCRPTYNLGEHHLVEILKWQAGQSDDHLLTWYFDVFCYWRSTSGRCGTGLISMGPIVTTPISWDITTSWCPAAAFKTQSCCVQEQKDTFGYLWTWIWRIFWIMMNDDESISGSIQWIMNWSFHPVSISFGATTCSRRQWTSPHPRYPSGTGQTPWHQRSSRETCLWRHLNARYYLWAIYGQ